MLGKEMTVRDLVMHMNEELKTIFEKPILKNQYRDYDTKDGRKVMTPIAVDNMLSDILRLHFSEEKLYTNYDRLGIRISGTPIKLYFRKKKSDMLNYNYNNQFTIIEVGVEGEEEIVKAMLDKKILDIVEEEKQKFIAKKQKESDISKQKMQYFSDELLRHNLAFHEFFNLQTLWRSLSYQEQETLKEYYKGMTDK